MFHRGAITVGHCEAKDIGLDINPRAMKDANKEQFERYRKALPNLVYTNGVDFRFYKQGQLTRDISIAISSWAYSRSPISSPHWRTSCATSAPSACRPSPRPNDWPR